MNIGARRAVPLPCGHINPGMDKHESNVSALGAEGAVFAIGFVGDGDEVGTEEDVAEQGIQVAAEADDLFGPVFG